MKTEIKRLEEVLKKDIDETMKASIEKRIEVLKNRETVEKNK